MYIETIIPKFIEEFEKRSKREKNYVSQNTIKTYSANLQKYLLFLKKNKYEMNIKKITEDDIIIYVNELVDKKLAPATRNQIISTLKSFFKWGKKYYQIKNPMIDVRCAYQQRKEARYISDPDIKLILSYIDKKGGVLQVITRTLVQSGLRASELIYLNIKDIKFEKDGMAICVRKGKGNKERTLPFCIVNENGTENTENLKLYNILKSYIRKRNNSGIGEKEALFVSNYNKRITYQGLHKKFLSLMTKLKLLEKGYTLHSCRHFCAVKLLKSKARLKVIQVFLGHSDPLSTLRIYDHVSISEIAEINKF